MTEFLHGTETIEKLVGPTIVQEVRTGIIALVGTAPVHHGGASVPWGRPVIVRTDADCEKFGPAASDANSHASMQGYTIPQALKDMRGEGAGTIVVVNLFDPEEHYNTVAGANRAITNGVATLPNGDIISATVKVAGGTGDPLVEGTDYTIDRVTGKLTTVAGGALDGDANMHVGYTHGAPEDVTDEEIIGGVSSGVRNGAQALLDCGSLFGFKPKLLTAPGYITGGGDVLNALNVLAQPNKLRAYVLCDASVGNNVEQAILDRGPGLDIDDLRLSDSRVLYLFPHLASGDPDDPTLHAYSPLLAGIIARTDRTKGYWKSPSNEPFLTKTMLEVPITASVNDAECEANQLNAAGIMTVFSGYGTGLKTWGNRNASFPGKTDIMTFTACRRCIDMIDESLELFALKYMDDITGMVLVQAILDDVNEFIRDLIKRGALMPGSNVKFHLEKNPAQNIANGQFVFTRTVCPPPPLERLTQESIVDTRLITQAFKAA
ncbi:MAG TPA: hypothetical protein VHO25_16750 [Polyangiaceae bacterium]|nr:hypothetical protein [Polyangiaceae bacterium]